MTHFSKLKNVLKWEAFSLQDSKSCVEDLKSILLIWEHARRERADLISLVKWHASCWKKEIRFFFLTYYTMNDLLSTLPNFKNIFKNKRVWQKLSHQSHLQCFITLCSKFSDDKINSTRGICVLIHSITDISHVFNFYSACMCMWSHNIPELHTHTHTRV